VADLVGRALEGAPADISPNQKAEQLRAFVREFVQTKDLSVGFATASEVARTAQGDCTEHAVLLAGLLRAAGIPSRTVSGLIYVSDPFVGQRDVFGYHMWTQAWLMPDGHAVGEPRWVDLDATRAVPFDSAHIALGVSAMDDTQLFNDLVKLAPMLGRVGIKVLESDGATKRRSDEGGDAPAASHGCWLHERQISAPYVVHIGGSLFHQTRGRFAPPFVASSLHRFPQ
jgi:hypothetical protein